MTLFALTGRKTQGPNDTIRDLILNGENFNDVAIEPLRPKLVTVTGVDQLNIDSETQSRFSDAASSNASTPRRLPISRASRFNPRKAKHDVLAGTRRSPIFVNALRISSATPSA